MVQERREQVWGTAEGQCDTPMLFASPELRTSGLWKLA